MEEKRKAGRPRVETYINPQWAEIILQSGREGKHITDFLIKIGIGWDTHYALLKRNKKYSEIVETYMVLCENYWFNLAHQSMEEENGASFNSRLFSLIVRNKFPKNWSEAQKIDITSKDQQITDTKTINIEIVKSKLDS